MMRYCLAVCVIFGINQERALKLNFAQRNKSPTYVLYCDSGKCYLIKCWVSSIVSRGSNGFR